MRFDLAVNGMTLGFFKNGQIPIMRDGRQWRPFVHVRDVAEAYVAVIRAPREKINGQLFNVGSDDQNYQILPLAREVARSLRIPFRRSWYGDPDSRSYKISFKKIRDVLGYKTRWSVADGAREIYDALKKEKIDHGIQTRTVEWYKYLLRAQKITGEVQINGDIL